MTAPDAPLSAEIVPSSAGPRPGTLARTADRDLRDALALGWIESYDTDSPNTAARYARDVPGWSWRDGAPVDRETRAPGSFFGWADDNGYDVFAMLPWHVEQYIRHLRTAEHLGRYTRSRRLAPSTIAGKVAAVSSWYRYAARQSRDRLVPNPTLGTRRPKPPAVTSTRCLTKDEVDALLAAALRAGRQEYALVMLLSTAGLRASEVCALDTGDLERRGTGWTLRVTRKGRGGATEPVPIAPVAARALRRHIRGRRGPMFQRRDGERLTRQALAYTVARLARAAFPRPHPDAPDPAEGITPHVFRHTVTTLALRQDGVRIQDVQALMGHASITTTQGYDHADLMLNNPAVAVIDALFADGLPDVE